MGDRRQLYRGGAGMLVVLRLEFVGNLRGKDQAT